MELTARVRTARTPLPTAMAIALAAVGLSLAVAPPASAQERANAQAEQSRALRNQTRSSGALPAPGRYVSDAGVGFTLDRAGNRPLLRFDGRTETWILRPSPAPRGDVIYRNDAGQQVLRVTPNGGVTVYSPRAPGGAPAAFAGPGQSLSTPVLGPLRLWSLMAHRSGMVSEAIGRLIQIDIETGRDAESLTVEALILSTDAVVRIARSPSARSSLNQLRRIAIVEGQTASVSYARGELRIVVAPSQGPAGRPSSARVIRAFLPQASASR